MYLAIYLYVYVYMRVYITALVCDFPIAGPIRNVNSIRKTCNKREFKRNNDRSGILNRDRGEKKKKNVNVAALDLARRARGRNQRSRRYEKRLVRIVRILLRWKIYNCQQFLVFYF